MSGERSALLHSLGSHPVYETRPPPAGASSEQSPTVGRWAITGVAIGEQSSKTRRRVLRRVNDRIQQVLTRGNITLNETTEVATVDEEPVTLSQAQIALLSTFMRHPNQVLTRDQLISLTFNDEFDGFDRAVDSQIARLRRQITRNGRQPIQTVYGAGYRFVVEDE